MKNFASSIERIIPETSKLLHIEQFRNPELRELAMRERKARIKELTSVIPHNDTFDKENLMKMKEHKWLKDIETNLVNPLNTSLAELLEGLLTNGDFVQDEVNLKTELPLVALDLEAYGLNTSIKIEGGEILKNNIIVGIPVAHMKNGKEVGYYIPVNHNPTKECPNFPEQDVFEFLNELHKRAFVIYHNSAFDRELLAIHKIRMSHNYADTMTLAIAVGLRPETKHSVGLKQLSKQELGREMIELADIMGSKDFIPLTKFEAKTLSVYGCSDACNTLALFNLFVRSDKYDNPFKTQKLAMKIDQKAMDATRSMLRFGLPVDNSHAISLLKTIIRRELLLEGKIKDTIGFDIMVSSTEKIGTWFGETMCNEFERKFITADTSAAKRDELLEKFNNKLKKDFHLEVKVKNNKAGKSVVYNSPDAVLESLQFITDTYEWFPKKVADKISLVCRLLSDYRTLVQRKSILGKLVKYARSDDYGICRAGINLKYIGTITTRYSNGKGTGDYDNVVCTESKKGYKVNYYTGNGVCGINAQGIPATSYRLTKAKKLKKIPQDIAHDYNSLTIDTEEAYTSLINEL